MPEGNYRVVSCEGGDQCGKADAVLTLRRKLLDRGVSVTFSSFPIYATPFGTCIRKFLTGGMDGFNFDSRDELRVKMALYALNRLEFLDVVLSDQEYSRTLILLDRGSFSNAVTLAYGIVNIEGLTDEEIDEYVKLAFWLDNLMIRKLKLKDCVVQLIALDAKEGYSGNRIQKDITERKDVQQMTEKTYDIYQDKVGEGWKKIVTRMEEGWGDREEIFNGIYEFVVSRYGAFSSEAFPKDLSVNVREIIENSYPGSEVERGDIVRYIDALEDNDKDQMYKYSIRIGEQISLTCEDFIIRDKEVERKFSVIFKRFPEIYEVLEEYLGERFKDLIKDSIEK